MALWEEFLRPQTLTDALSALMNAPRPLAIIAGGTDLLLDLEQRRHAPVHSLVDITGIRELLALEIRDDSFFVGAGVPVSRIAADREAGQHAAALVEACELIAGPQVRNVATLGGNVAHALPAADGTIALLALNAQAEVADTTGTRRVPFKELFVAPGKSSLKHGEELLVGFYLPITNPQLPITASCFKRIVRPQGVALPILNCAVWLEREDDLIKDIRIAVGPGGGTPFRATRAEDALRSKTFNSESFESATDALLTQALFRISARRASADYRQHIVIGLFKDTLNSAWERAG